MQVQGTFLAKEDKKVTFATLDGQVKYGYVGGDCTLTPQQPYIFNVEVKTSKAGKQYNVISSITDSTGKAIDIAKSSGFGGKKGRYDSEGQARGNYRQCLTQFIVAKNLALDMKTFNKLLKEGELDYFGSVKTGVTDESHKQAMPQTQPTPVPQVVPTQAQGLV